MTTLHPLAADYLGRLRAAAAVLPSDQANDLVADLEEHLLAALPPDASEAQVRTVLDRLGTPEQVVTAASDEQPVRLAPAATPAPGLTREWIALTLLVCWAFLLFFPPLAIIGWVVGVGLLLASPRWTPLDKVLGVAASLLPVGLMLGGLTAYSVVECTSVVDGDPTCTGGAPAAVMIAAAVALGLWAVLAIYALVRLIRRLR